tara:strand:+ start:266 stop:616 length:351 start_codon:yes stop_codon:yes gene_type:complete
MLQIKCPNCGYRDEIEFSCGGEAHISRPDYSISLTDKEWSEYLFLRSNPKGIFVERWVHSHGCRRWFNLVRDTVTNEIFEIYLIGSFPKTSEGRIAYKNNWRRHSISELKINEKNK